MKSQYYLIIGFVLAMGGLFLLPNWWVSVIGLLTMAFACYKSATE